MDYELFSQNVEEAENVPSKTEKVAPVKIAVVDIQKVFHEYEKKKTTQQQ